MLVPQDLVSNSILSLHLGSEMVKSVGILSLVGMTKCIYFKVEAGLTNNCGWVVYGYKLWERYE